MNKHTAAKPSFMAFVNFKSELKKLEHFYAGSIYSYDQTSICLKYQNHTEQEFDVEFLRGLKITRPPKRIKLRSWGNSFKRQLSEVIYVRLISAFEVLLVDLIRDVFLLTKEPFKRGDLKIEYNHAQLLSMNGVTEIFSKIINKECRKLTSSGYEEIVKYYKRHFDIDLNSYHPGLSKIDEYYDVRHLLVHRLGKIDKQFKDKYDFEISKIFENESYIKNCIADFREFAKLVNNQLQYQISTNFISKNRIEKLYERKVFIEIGKEIENRKIIENECEFWVDDDLIKFKDILINRAQLDDLVKITIGGNSDVIKNYQKNLKNFCRKNNIYLKERIEHYNLPSYVARKTEFLDEKLLEKIKKLLPEQPWPKGIHKDIATNIDVSNKLVSLGIQQLIVREIFKPQFNGIVYQHGDEIPFVRWDLSQ